MISDALLDTIIRIEDGPTGKLVYLSVPRAQSTVSVQIWDTTIGFGPLSPDQATEWENLAARLARLRLTVERSTVPAKDRQSKAKAKP